MIATIAASRHVTALPHAPPDTQPPNTPDHRPSMPLETSRGDHDPLPPNRSPEVMECPRIASTDLDVLWLLARFGDVERTGASTREIQKLPPRNGAVFLALPWRGKQCKTAKPPRFTKIGQEPVLFCKILREQASQTWPRPPGSSSVLVNTEGVFYPPRLMWWRVLSCPLACDRGSSHLITNMAGRCPLQCTPSP